MTRRLIQLFIGLVLYGLSIALIVRADLGLDPWDVLNQGVFERFAGPAGISFGLVVNLIGMAVLLLWIPLRQKPGIGTVANVLVIGTVANFGLNWIPSDLGLPLQASLLIGGIVLNGVASGAYIGAGLGPGPRDGLMTGIVARTGWPVKWVRTSIELAVIAVGWLLGGSVGLGTVLYAVTIGPLVHVFLPMFTIRPKTTD
ncbi:YczE/YyaS/YitT family protein [Brevundimonas sp. DWR2-3-1b1]|uniref:membrane protein YczE n=1 Tax=unclassified Brevundimonas TaxID=2622653 RepID=UPI003CEAFC46